MSVWMYAFMWENLLSRLADLSLSDKDEFYLGKEGAILCESIWQISECCCSNLQNCFPHIYSPHNQNSEKTFTPSMRLFMAIIFGKVILTISFYMWEYFSVNNTYTRAWIISKECCKAMY